MMPRPLVYIIGNRELSMYKIGRSHTDPRMRLVDLQGCSPVRLTLISFKFVKDAVASEARLHRQLANKRQHGEWFKLTPEELNAITIDDDELLDDQSAPFLHSPSVFHKLSRLDSWTGRGKHSVGM